MAWKYDGLNPWALHLESQTRFGIRYGRKLKSLSDFDLVPPEDQAKKWPPDELDHLKAGLWVEMNRVWEQASLRDRLQSLIRTKLGGDNYRAANVISGISGKTVSARSIQASSSRPREAAERVLDGLWTLWRPAPRRLSNAPQTIKLIFQSEDGSSGWNDDDD